MPERLSKRELLARIEQSLATWEVIASNTYEHHSGHTPHARAWLVCGPP